MITHKVTLPDGTEIEFFATDPQTFSQAFGYPSLDDKGKAKQTQASKRKKARKHQQQARRKQR
ncbi:hypothetical protein BMT54_08380 [Pasteurellaceae bacterium 15-036681]|nr:hypothetical protein BMT54_08380 [Pasteurellaceae bacterium 15-036681]